MMQMNANSA